jgi:hypothetical protein
MDTSALMNMWIDICVENSRPEDMNNFSLRTVLPKLLREDTVLELYNGEEDEESDINDNSNQVNYITEQELRRIWSQASNSAMGKPLSAFSVEEALLLLPDAEADELMFQDGTLESEGGSSAAADAAALLESEEGAELYVTDQELQAVWANRGEVRWGMPNGGGNGDFDAKLALLLLDAEDDDDEYTFDQIDKLVEGEIGYVEEETGEGLVEVGAGDDGDGDGDGLQRNDLLDTMFRSKGDAMLRDALLRAHAELDTNEYLRPAWKKDRHILTPDIDTQNFIGDIMNSNLYMTTRIPANWNDPELEEMSQTYLDCGTMAWPGEEETDYNVVPPIWQVLNLPCSPAGIINSAKTMSEENDIDFDAMLAQLDMVVSRYERRQAGLVESPAETMYRTDSGAYSGSDLFGNNDQSQSELDQQEQGQGEEEDDALDVDKFFSNLGGGTGSDDEDDEADDGPGREITSPLEPTQLDPKLIRKPKFITPPSWADDNPDFADHVDFAVWSNYFHKEEQEAASALTNEDGKSKSKSKSESKSESESESEIRTSTAPLVKEWYEADDSVWVDDLVVAESVAHLLTATEAYLTDHTEVGVAIDDLKHWRRAMAFKFTGGEDGSNYPENEEIPAHLTPDKEDGIEYGDELIEMKGKVTLAANLPPPAELFAGDSFDHNTDASTINKVGTIREQYDWLPLEREEPFLICDKVLGKIEPVLRYVNHVAVLQSTRDNILVFDYRGQMRHIVGMRATMLQIARECFPEVVDVRLETDRMSDKFDGTFSATK